MLDEDGRASEGMTISEIVNSLKFGVELRFEGIRSNRWASSHKLGAVSNEHLLEGFKSIAQRKQD